MGKYYILEKICSGKLIGSKIGDIFEISSIIIYNICQYN